MANFGNAFFHPSVKQYEAAVKPLWLEVKERKVAGGTFNMDGIAKGTLIPAGLPVRLDVMGGDAVILDGYKVLAAVTDSDTSISLEGVNGTVPRKGMILGKMSAAGTASKAAALGDQNEDGSFAITADALGALAIGDILYIASAAGSSKAAVLPNGLTWRQIYASENDVYAGTVTVVTKGQILGSRIPEMPDYYKDALTGITFEYEPTV